MSTNLTTMSQAASHKPSLLRNRSFLLLWGAYGISAFGDHLSELGLMRLLQIEHSTRQVQTQALMTFLFFIPFFLVGWLAGVVADRLPRRLIMIIADLARAAIILSLPLWVQWQVAARGEHLEQSDLVRAMLPLLALGIFAAFFSPARQALLPQLVRDDQLVQANSISSGLGTISAMLSNMVGGVLAAISPRLNFLTDAATFFASALLLAGIRVPGVRNGRPDRRSLASSEVKAEPFHKMVLEGVSYVRTHCRVMELILLAAIFWTAAGIFTSMLPSVVFDRFHLGYAWVGWTRGSLAGGMVLGAILLTTLGDRIHGELANLVGLTGAGAALIGFAWAPTITIGMVMAILVGLAGAMLLISVSTMLQRIVPNRSRGRVFGIADMATMAGLLLATGLLGLWTIPGLDGYVPHVLTVLGLVMVATGAIMHNIQASRSGLGWQLQLLWRCNQFYVRWWYRAQRVGGCSVPVEGPAILAANHTSYIDPLVLYATCSQRVIGFLVASIYLQNAGIGLVPAEIAMYQHHPIRPRPRRYARGPPPVGDRSGGRHLPARSNSLGRWTQPAAIGHRPLGATGQGSRDTRPYQRHALRRRPAPLDISAPSQCARALRPADRPVRLV